MSLRITEHAASTIDGDAARVAYGVAGLLALLTSIGIYESQMTVMFFDKSIDVTVPLLATFAASLLAPLVGSLLGPRRALVATSLVLALALVVETIFRDERFEVVASAAGVVAGTWWLALFVSSESGHGSSLSVAAPAALGLTLVLRAGARTMPLDEVPLFAAVPIVFGVVLGLGLGIRSMLRDPPGWTSTDRRGAASLFALPFAFALAADVALNGGFSSGAAGMSLGAVGAGSAYVGLLAAGVGVAAGLLASVSPMPRGPIASVALAIGALLLWTRLGVGSLVGGVLLAFGLVLAVAVLGSISRRPAQDPVRIPVALGLGWLASVLVALIYYVEVGFVPALVGMVALVAAAAWLVRADRPRAPRAVVAAVIVIAILAISATALTLATVPSPATAARAGQLRVMTYNVHLGYSDGDVPSVSEIAAVIEAESPDLVALEEVTRGSVIAGGHDILGLLAERLGMSYAFAPMMGDIEGVAILSRLPIERQQVIPLTQAPTRDLRRVALVVDVGGLTFVATHLGGDDKVAEVRSMIDLVGGGRPIIIAGDMNSVPDSPEMALFGQAGFTDLGKALGERTFPVTAPDRRIDYLWAIGVTANVVRTPRTSASDHLPVVADVTVP